MNSYSSCTVLLTLLSTLITAYSQETNPDSSPLTLTLSQARYNQTTHSTSVTLSWTVRIQLEDFLSYRVKCSNVQNDQQNRHWRRAYNPALRTLTITELTVNTQYICCVELNLDNRVEKPIKCDKITLTPPENAISTTPPDTTSVRTTEHAQNNQNGGATYTQDDVTGLQVVIALLCVILAVTVTGWIITGLVAYLKIVHYRRDRSGQKVRPHHWHNPGYTPSTLATIPNDQTHPAQQENPSEHEYEYIRFPSFDQRPGRRPPIPSPNPNTPTNRTPRSTSGHAPNTPPRHLSIDTSRYLRDFPSPGETLEATQQRGTTNTGSERQGAAQGHGGYVNSERLTPEQSITSGRGLRGGMANNFGLPMHYETMAAYYKTTT